MVLYICCVHLSLPCSKHFVHQSMVRGHATCCHQLTLSSIWATRVFKLMMRCCSLGMCTSVSATMIIHSVYRIGSYVVNTGVATFTFTVLCDTCFRVVLTAFGMCRIAVKHDHSSDLKL